MNFIFSTAVFIAAICVVTFALLDYENSPVPDPWNPLRPFDAMEPVTPVTNWKFKNFLNSDLSCSAELSKLADFEELEEFEASPQCFIKDRVGVSELSGMQINRLDTSCQTALRLALWLHHDVKPAAIEHLGQEVASVEHIGSYNCRSIRGQSERMSSHATAEAVDISGFGFADGTKIELSDNWNTGDPAGGFFESIRDRSCFWFGATLGPDFNTLHEDHFHLQNNGWGTCQ